MAQTNLSGGSFALQQQDAVQQRSTSVQLGQSGMQGGQAFAADRLQAQQIDTSTSDALMRMGQAILEPQIKKIQTQQFLEGAQRVAQGEALTDIVNEDPWYTKIFGPSSSAQGARTVAQMKGVDDYITSVAQDMPELQKLDSKQFGQKITAKMQDFLTGDDVADAAIQMKMVESTGALFKAHTKANYKWTQTNMQQQVSGYMLAGGQKLQAMTAQVVDGTVSTADFNRVKADFIGNLMPLDGQSPESYWGAVQNATIDALANGNHHAANAIFDSGIFKNAPLETRKAMLDAKWKYEKQTQETAGFYEYGPRIGILKGKAAAGQMTGNEIMKEVDSINREYSLSTGIQRPLFQRKELEGILSGNISKIYNRNEQDQRDLARENRADRREGAKEQAKADMETRKAEQLVGLIQMGAGNMATTAGYSATEVNNAVFQGAQVIAGKGGDVGQYLVQQYNQGGAHVNPQYKNLMEAGMRASKMEGHAGESFNTSYSMYKQIAKEAGGTGAAMAYMGDDAIRMMNYDKFVTSGKMVPEVAYQLAFGPELDSTRKSSDKKIGEVIQKTVASDQPGMWSSMFGGVALTDQSQRVLQGAVGATYDKLVANTGMDDSSAMKAALTMAKSELDVVGPYAFPRGNNRKPVYQLIGSDERAAGQVFTEFLNIKAAQNGVEGSMPGDTKLDTVGRVLANSPVGTLAKDAAAAYAGEPGPGLLGAVSDASPIPTAVRTAGIMFGNAPTVMVSRLPDQDGEGIFGVTIVAPDGTMKNFPIHSNELRDFYEKSKHFK